MEHLRKELHDYQSKFLEQNSQLDQLLDEQKHLSQSMIRLKTVLGVDATDHDELLDQLLHKMEQSQLIENESKRLANDLHKQKVDYTNLSHELQHLEQQFDDLKDELNKSKQQLISNQTKYDQQLHQHAQSFEQLQKEKNSNELQFADLQEQFLEQTNQYEQLQTKFHQLSMEKDQQISTLERDLNEQQSLQDKLRRELTDLHDELESKINQIQQLSQQKTTLIEDNHRKEQILFEQKQFTEVHTALEEKFNTILAEKAGLANELDTIRVQMQTTESTINKRKQDHVLKLEQAEKRIQELQVSVQYSNDQLYFELLI